MVSNAVMPDELGGLQRYVRELGSALAALEIPVTMLTKRTSPDQPNSETYPDGVSIRRYPIPDRSAVWYAGGYPLATVHGIARHLRAFNGVIHVHFPLQGAVVASSRRQFVHTFHAPIYKEVVSERRYALAAALEKPLVSTTRRVERFVAGRARESVVLTEFMRSELAMLSPGAASRATLIPAGIDTDFFAPGRGTDHPTAADTWPILFTARRLVPRTGVSELIRAMPAVISEHPHAVLAIAGDGALRADIERLIPALGLETNVILLGRVSDESLRAWYRSATLFVLPTQELEGFGMSTVEALACGTLAVGTPAGGTPEVLGSLDRRLITNGTTAHDISAAILTILADRDTFARLSEQARAYVVPSLSWATIADRHLEIYERVAASGRR